MSETPDLKTCPFCGGKARLYVEAGWRGPHKIDCHHCDFTMTSQIPEGVVPKWNRRSHLSTYRDILHDHARNGDLVAARALSDEYAELSAEVDLDRAVTEEDIISAGFSTPIGMMRGASCIAEGRESVYVRHHPTHGQQWSPEQDEEWHPLRTLREFRALCMLFGITPGSATPSESPGRT